MYCGQLTEPERADIRTEFGNGKSRIPLQLKMKIDCWRFLPLRLVGLGHWNEERVRHCAAVCVAQLQMANVEQRRHMHAVTQNILQWRLFRTVLDESLFACIRDSRLHGL